MSASPVDVAVNPNNTAQRYVLWGNGRVDAIGGAPNITSGPQFFDRLDLPVAVALHITNWTTGQGYVLDFQGRFNPLNGAPTLGTDGVVVGVPYVTPDEYAAGRGRKYQDWAWNPDGSGQGYVLDLWGQLYAFGGATAPPRSGPRFTQPKARRLAMRFSPDVRAITVDMFGNLFTDFAAVLGPVPSYFGRGTLDTTRDMVITDWTAGAGYLLDLYGGMHAFGGAVSAGGGPYNPGGDMARTLAVLNSSDPRRFWQVWAGGQSFDFYYSTPPTVDAGANGPDATVTSTTRPDLTWSYSDPQADSQAGFQVLVFTQAFVDGHSMTDPLAWLPDALVAREGVQATARGIACPIDLPNGSYRMYVRVKDSAGQWSAWDNHGWSQNIAAPSTPTGLTATADEATFSVLLSVTATTGQAADFVRFECSDDGGTTWQPVRGAGAVPLGSTTTARDYDTPLGATRTYRAVAYATDPAVASAPSGTATAALAARTYVLTAVDNPSLGGKVRAQEPVDWTRPVVAGVFQGAGADYATVVKDGRPKGKRASLHVFSEDADTWAVLEGLAESGSTLVYRDPFGAVRYCELVGDWAAALFPGAATRHMHTTSLPLVEVRPPHLEV